MSFTTVAGLDGGLASREEEVCESVQAAAEDACDGSVQRDKLAVDVLDSWGLGKLGVSHPVHMPTGAHGSWRFTSPPNTVVPPRRTGRGPPEPLRTRRHWR